MQERGWDFLSRVHGRTMVSPELKMNWIRIEHFFERATIRARYLGFINIVKRNPLACHAQRERTPWFIVTSLHFESLILNVVSFLETCPTYALYLYNISYM